MACWPQLAAAHPPTSCPTTEPLLPTCCNSSVSAALRPRASLYAASASSRRALEASIASRLRCRRCSGRRQRAGQEGASAAARQPWCRHSTAYPSRQPKQQQLHSHPKQRLRRQAASLSRKPNHTHTHAHTRAHARTHTHTHEPTCSRCCSSSLPRSSSLLLLDEDDCWRMGLYSSPLLPLRALRPSPSLPLALVVSLPLPLPLPSPLAARLPLPLLPRLLPPLLSLPALELPLPPLLAPRPLLPLALALLGPVRPPALPP